MCDPISALTGGGSSAKTDRTTQLFNTGKAQDIAGFLQNFGQKLTGKGTTDVSTGLSDTEKASKYYSDILSGDPTKVLASVAPEVNAIAGQTDEAKRQISQGGNRAGGTNAGILQLFDKARGAVANTIAKARPAAAAGVERTGAQTAGVGLQETGQGLGAESTAMSGDINLANLGMQSRGQSQKIHDQAVDDWATAISMILFGA